MGKADEKKWRAAFRKNVLERDGYKCRICGMSGTDENLDPHHITDRHDMPNGGYVVENGITLCKVRGFGKLSCHEAAEEYLSKNLKQYSVVSEYSPDSLYKLIGSNHMKAFEASKKLGDK